MSNHGINRNQIHNISVNQVTSPNSLSKKNLSFTKPDVFVPRLSVGGNQSNINPNKFPNRVKEKKHSKHLFPEIAQKKINEITLRLFDMGI